MTIRWSRRATRDLAHIHLYIAADDETAADRWVKKLWDRAAAAAEMPMAGRMVREFRRNDIREVLVGNYRIIYRVDRDHIVIAAVLERHRLLSSPPPVDPDDK